MTQLTKQQKAALGFNKHLSVTANAGSGKTFVLAKRFVEIALTQNIPLSKIVAITFTEKAASELYQRISREFRDRAIVCQDSNELKKINYLRSQLLSSNISTIHSFCINLLKEFPLEADIDANFSPIENFTSNDLILQSIEETLNSIVRDDEAFSSLKNLIRYFGNKNFLIKNLKDFFKKRKIIDEFKSSLKLFSENDLALKFVEYFYKDYSFYVRKDIDRLIVLIKNINDYAVKDKKALNIAVDVNNKLNIITASEEIIDRLRYLQEIFDLILTTNNLIKKRGYLSDRDNIDGNLISETEKLIKNLSGIIRSDNSFEVYYDLAVLNKDLLLVYEKCEAAYEYKKKQSGYLDFEDLLLKTKKILANDSVLKQMMEKFNYIMIDEYQDTNELQYDIFMPILDYLGRGNLFVVGDEKQSIYRFREAELEIFAKTKDDIVKSSSRENLIELPHSFRMRSENCAFVNYVFSRILFEPDKRYNEVSYTDLICAKHDDKKREIKILVGQTDDNEEENEYTNKEAELIAKQIINITNDSSYEINYGDIAILSRVRKDFIILEKTLSKYSIPYKILGGIGFFQQQTIYDVYNYLSFLLNKDNSTALVGLLRSPFFMISDSEIFLIDDYKGNNFWEKFNTYSLEKGGYSEIVGLLEENIELAKKIDLISILRKIVEESNYSAIITARKAGNQEIANLEKLYVEANRFSGQPLRTLYDFINYLEDSIEENSDEGQADTDDTSQTVKIMTFHKAKGLEFDAVFLFNSSGFKKHNQTKSKNISVYKGRGFLEKMPVRDNYFEMFNSCGLLSVYDYVENLKEYAEYKRLLYVGATRAKRLLYITGTIKNNWNIDSKSFLGLLFQIFNIEAETEYVKFSDNVPEKLSDDTTETSMREINFNIEIIKELNKELSIFTNNEKTKNDVEIDIKGILDKEKEEIISATKINIFSQCPLKYHLTYELGYHLLLNEFIDEEKSYDYKVKEDEDLASYGTLKGSIIHKLLEEDVAIEIVEQEIDEFILNEERAIKISKEHLQILKDEIIEVYKNFLQSDASKQLKNYSEFKNEFEVYIKHNDYYLYGIIDKLVIDENVIRIFDYKTDNVNENNVQAKFENYLPQLKFYSVIVSKLFPEIKNFELNIIFLKLPEKKFSLKLDVSNINLFEKFIENSIYLIREKKYEKNLLHCKKCMYYSDGNCVLK